MKTSSWGGSLYTTGLSFFPSLCVCVRLSHICLSLSLPVCFPALSHKSVSKTRFKRLESPSSFFSSFCRGFPIIAAFKDRTLAQRALHALVHFPLILIRDDFEAREDRLRVSSFLFYSAFLERESEGVRETGNVYNTDEEEFIPVCGRDNIIWTLKTMTRSLCCLCNFCSQIN